MKVFIVGKEGNQPFKIEAEGVSAEHARITIDDSGSWTLEDLKGGHGNGTFIKNEKGQFVPIVKCSINERTVIRLADAGHYSFTFMAHHLIAKNPKDFSFEFAHIYKLSEDFKQKEEAMEQTLQNHRKITIGAPIVAMGFTFLPIFSNPILARMLIAFSSSLVNMFFFGDQSKQKELRKIRNAVIVCPNCNKPLSEFDVNNRRCSLCKAQ